MQLTLPLADELCLCLGITSYDENEDITELETAAEHARTDGVFAVRKDALVHAVRSS